MRMSTEERFESHVDRSGGPDACHLWTASCHYHTGYGQFGISAGKTVGAHRFAWELVHGAVPEKLHICHRCDNRKCANHVHLFAGTRQDNMDDMCSKGRQAKGDVVGRRGEANGRAKLTSAQVASIAEMVTKPGISRSAVAQEFGVHRSQIDRIARGYSWTGVEISESPSLL